MGRKEQIKKEGKAGPQSELQRILKDFNIPHLPPLSSKISVIEGKGGSLILSNVLGLSRKEVVERYLERPLEILTQRREEAVGAKPHGRRPRSRPDKKRVRGHFQRLEQSLITNGPAKVLAAIALNEGRDAEWSIHGVRGDENWNTPLIEEEAFWAWVYEKTQGGTNVGEWWKNGTGNILHAIFIMRHRVTYGEIGADDFQAFIDGISPLLPETEEIDEFLMEIRGRLIPKP